jgi:hypothetical protein
MRLRARQRGHGDSDKPATGYFHNGDDSGFHAEGGG